MTLEAALDKIDQVKEENNCIRAENSLLQQKIKWLQQQLYGSGKSEKLNDAQLKLKLEAMDEQVRELEEQRQKISYERAKPKRRQVPAEHFENLPVNETVEIIPDEVKAEPSLYKRIGEEKTFEVDIIPPRLFKRLIIRPCLLYTSPSPRDS